MKKWPLALLAFAACAFAAAQEPDEIVISLFSRDPQFNPQHSIYSPEAQIFTGIYEGLFSYNPSDLTPVKAVAKSFTKSKDGLSYTFYLREDARWSNGDPVLASDFRDAWLNMIDPATKAEYAVFFDAIRGARDYRTGATKDASKVGISVIADKVLQVRLENPTPYFARMLCHHSFAPVHPSMLRKAAWDDPVAIPCNGPYRIAAWDGSELSLERNEEYWDAKSVAVPRIRILTDGEPEDLTRRFNNGEIQWLGGSFVTEDILQREAFMLNPIYGTTYWYFRCVGDAYSDPDVRRALALLVPWPEVRDEDYYWVPTSKLILPLGDYPEVDAIEKADAEEAFALLEKAGYPEGEGLPELVILALEGEDSDRVTGIFKKAWKKLPGLKVTVKSVTSEMYWKEAKKNEYTIALTTWIADFPDPVAFLSLWTSGSNLNDALYANPEYDAIIVESGKYEGAERLDILGEAEALLLSQAVIMPVSHHIAFNIIDTELVLGWYMNALDIHPLKYLALGTPSEKADVVLAAPELGPVASGTE